MSEEIARGLYRQEIPLPGNPLKSLNAYLIKGSGRNLIIDTGFALKDCLDAMQNAVEEIGIDLRETDFFITHFHADHLGLLSSLLTDTSKVFFNKPDADFLARKDAWERALEYADTMSFPEHELQSVKHNHPGVRHGGGDSGDMGESILLDDGDVIRVGDYHFRCVQTPGHTWGHTCLYEPALKYLVAGDHILSEITPTIQLWSQTENPLGAYLDSLDKIARLDVELVLPGHRGLLTNCRGRIRELKDHYRCRLDEILSILRDGPMNAYQVAMRMSWNVEYKSWEQFPLSQRWFATGEAISHLKYLEEKHDICRNVQNGKILFALVRHN